jgi:hypothetical protein
MSHVTPFPVLISILVGTLSIRAHAEPEKNVSSTTPNKTNIVSTRIHRIADRLDGELTLSYFNYFKDSTIDPTDPFFSTSLLLDFQGEFDNSMVYVIKPRFQIDNADRASQVFNLIETSRDRQQVNFDEIFIDYYATNYQITAGKQIYSWGVSDTYKPVENLNPYDVVDLPAASKMGVYSIGATGIWEDLSLETAIIPWFTPTRLPRQDNRWLGNTQSQSDALHSILGFDPTVNFAGRDLPDNSINNVHGGVRLTSSSLFPGWDLGLTYTQGRDPIGVVRTTTTNPPVINTTQMFQQFQEFGTTVSTTFGSLEAHSETAYRNTINNAYDDDFIEYVAGINYTHYNTPGVEEVRLVAEYAGEEILSKKTVNNGIVPTGQYIRPFKNSFIGSVECKFTEETQFIVAGAFNFNDRDFFLQPKLSHQFNSGMELDIGLDFMEGNQNSFFGHWDRNNRMFLVTRYAF